MKTINSHQIEFSRLHYPLRYQVFIRIENENPLMVVIQKDENSHEWNIKSEEHLEAWVQDMGPKLIDLIEKNELNTTLAAV
ncbi:MAG TPA: hypothetical protein VF623_09615 [Segetibacter sp.]